MSEISGREKEFEIFYDTAKYRKDIFLFPNLPPKESDIIIIDTQKAMFANCFKNKFIYEYSIVMHSFSDMRVKVIREIPDKENQDIEFQKINTASWLFYKTALYDFISQNLLSGEFAELYREMTNHANFNLGPPKFEHSVKLCDFIDFPDSIYVQNKRKITIYM